MKEKKDKKGVEYTSADIELMSGHNYDIGNIYIMYRFQIIKLNLEAASSLKAQVMIKITGLAQGHCCGGTRGDKIHYIIVIIILWLLFFVGLFNAEVSPFFKQV